MVAFYRLTIVLSILFLSTAVSGEPDRNSGEASQPVLRFGVVPQQAPSKLLRTWKPLLEYVETHCQCRLVFATARDIPAFERRLSEQEYDLAYMNPYHFTVYNDKNPKYHALVRAKDKRIKGIIVVSKDSPLSHFESLDDADIAFPAPAAFAATVLPQAHLRNANLKFRPHYVSSHDSVYKAVASGLFPAGGGVVRTYELIDEATAQKLKIIWQTPEYTPHAVAIGEWIDVKLRVRLQEAFLLAGSVESVDEILKPLNVKGFEVAADHDWDDVRELEIEKKLGGQ